MGAQDLVERFTRMAYAKGNPRTKKALKALVAAGNGPMLEDSGIFPSVKNGVVTIEGPHFPEPHKYYARVEVKDGKIVKVLP